MIIYHIAFADDWRIAQEQGMYRHHSLEREGFIHCSTADQLVATANRFFSGQFDLVVLAIDPAKLEAEMLFEESEPGQFFPHIYGPLNLNAVNQTIDFPPDQDGTFTLPVE